MSNASKSNPLGLAGPTRKCPACGEDFVPDLVDIDPNFYDNHYKWRREGLLIQNVWPDSTLIQREQLMSGLCSDICWDAFLT